MATVSIKCPNCGGALELDDSKEFGFCMFCGTQVRVQDEKTRVEVSGSVKLNENDKYGNYLTLATRAFEAKNMSEAYTYYTKALEIKQSDYLPIFRKALCAGYLSDDLGLRIEEVVMGITTAYNMVSDQNIQKNMAEEIVTFALSDPLQVVTTFYSSDECARYVKGIYNRITLLNRLYTFLDKDNAETTSKYIEVTLSYCKMINMKSIQFVAGTRVNKGNSETVFGTYPISPNILAEIGDINRRLSEEHNKYIRPKIEMVKSELNQINQQIKALPPLLQIAHYICNWWLALLGLLLAPSGIGIAVWVAQIALLIVSKAQDKDKTASTLYQQYRAKKKELTAFSRQLKK